jgi:Outer membrane protein beta-barrel domain
VPLRALPRILAGVLSILIAALCPASLPARDRLPYAGARVGYLQLKDVDTGSLNLGILGGLYFAPRVAIEGSLDYHAADFDQYGRETLALQGSLYVYPFTAKHAFRPYGVAGAGFYWNDYNADENSSLPEDNRTDGGFHAGFGFDVLLTKQSAGAGAGAREQPVCLTVDFRYLFTQNDPDGSRSDGLLATIGIKVGF